MASRIGVAHEVRGGGRELHSSSRRFLRKAKLGGRILAIIGLSVPAVTIPTSAWLNKSDESAFNQYVGWANILALTVGVIGVVVVIAEKMGTFRSYSRTELAEIAEQLVVEVRRQENRTLARLLSTDSLDSRPADFRISLQGRAAKSKKSATRRVDPSKLADFFLDEAKGRMVLLGGPGSGKTVLAIQLLLQLVSRRTTENVSVPVIFALASWNPTKSDLEEWLTSQLSIRFALEEKVARKLVEHGLIVPILDGLDEMDQQDAAKHRSTRAVERINDFTASTADCRILVISRSGPQYYERVARKVRATQTVVIQQLTATQIIDHIRTHCAEEHELDAWQCVFEGLRGAGSRTVVSALGTPWRLSAAVIFHKYGGEPADLLPTSAEKKGRSDAYLERVHTLLMEYFLESRVRIFQTKRLRPAKTISWLHLIAKRMSAHGGQSNEIVLHDWWRLLDERKVRVGHLFFTFTVLHLPFAINGSFGISTPSGEEHGFLTYIAIMSNYLTIMFISMWRCVRDREPTRLTFNPFKDIRILAMSALFTAITGGIIGITYGLAYGPVFGALSGLTAAITTVFAVASAQPHPSQASSPLEMLQNDRRVALLSGFLIGACAGLYYLKLYGISIALIYAEMCVLGRFCCSAYARYFIATVYGWARYGLPLVLPRFLEWGRQSGVFRTSGAGFQFRHQELQDYLQSSGSSSRQ
ncbi:NACHT domain-containing protein [Amycolatopsis kentuckyensis]|uniref:NACHT domain-containing protein n=1 Tax=Amycolatopsis kentuckyensis TaxID=218823 RepID=UPI000A372CB8|nr:NACHT domain-containing protein [Amycolatopsis kentuckyensis]